MTLFAPDNLAFDKAFDELEKRYLWSEWGHEARVRVLGRHIVENIRGDKNKRSNDKPMPDVGWRGSFIGQGSVESQYRFIRSAWDFCTETALDCQFKHPLTPR
jgi:uncharacterized surface protein with fasciclin (FAS1) repeats